MPHTNSIPLMCCSAIPPKHVTCPINRKVLLRRGYTLKCRTSTEDQEKKTYRVETNSSWSGILFDKFVDSVDDVGMHLRRIVKGPPTRRMMQRFEKTKTGDFEMTCDEDEEESKPVVLVLGSGWAAHSIIKIINTDEFRVVCVSPSNAFLFTPMLPSTAVGTVEFRSLLEPIRVANPFVNYLEAQCTDLDVVGKKATCVSSVPDTRGDLRRFEVKYDCVVVAVGEIPASFGVRGVDQHAYYLKTVTDSVRLRKRIQEVFELASLPGTTEEEIEKLLSFIIVGGGPTGVEFAGTLSDFLTQDLRRKYPELEQYIRISLLQSGDTILTQFDKRLAQIAMKNLEKIGVNVRTNVRVTEVTDSMIVLQDGEEIPYGVCVWSAGNAPNQLVLDIANSIPEQKELSGGRPRKLMVDAFLRVVGAEDMIALGDCSQIMTKPLPPTAQVAAQQGAFVAHVINRRYNIGRGGENLIPPFKNSGSLSVADRLFSTMTSSVDTIDDPSDRLVYLKKPFQFLSLGIMASVGNEKAVAQVEAFDNTLSVWGSPAFLLWKSVYITKQVSFRNRVLILFDWLKTRVFGRDLSQF